MSKAIKHEPREEIPEEWTLPKPNENASPTLQEEIEEILDKHDDFVAYVYDRNYLNEHDEVPKDYNQRQAIEAILQAIAKRLPENKTGDDIQDFYDNNPQVSSNLDENGRMQVCASRMMGFNHAITEIKKELGVE
jgi:transketolase